MVYYLGMKKKLLASHLSDKSVCWVKIWNQRLLGRVLERVSLCPLFFMRMA